MIAVQGHSQDRRDPFSQNFDGVFELMLLHLAAQSLQRLVQRLIAETKRAIVHRYHILRSKFSERSDCFLRIHVHLPTARRFVSADRQKRNFDGKTRTNFFESSEVSTITAVKNRPLPQ